VGQDVAADVDEDDQVAAEAGRGMLKAGGDGSRTVIRIDQNGLLAKKLGHAGLGEPNATGADACVRAREKNRCLVERSGSAPLGGRLRQARFARRSGSAPLGGRSRSDRARSFDLARHSRARLRVDRAAFPCHSAEYRPRAVLEAAVLRRRERAHHVAASADPQA
jgi:hypothetical protein